MAAQGSSNPFYRSKAWLKVRAQALKRDNYCCTICGISIRGRGQSRVDHTIPLKVRPDLSLELSNLQSLCPGCDNRKSIDERNRKGQAPREQIGLDGLPDGWR
jgi:5-methylcytosine-specific restriction endonuclease McrA